METEHRYKLDKSSKKYHCPQCSKKRLVRYFDTKKNEYLPEQYGRCDREAECSYQLNPFSDGYAKAISEQEQGENSELPKWKPRRKAEQPKPKPIYFDFETFKKTLSNYEQNVFVQNLIQKVAFPFEVDEVTNVIELYRLGTVANGYRAGAITFPFIDVQNNVRAIQVKQFNEANHTKGTDFLHSIIEKHYNRNNTQLPEWLEAYTKQDKKVSCLFGEHLLKKFPTNPIALVEAPKTAVYGTLYFGLPECSENLIWLAVYNKSSFSIDKMGVLKGRNIFVFPDLSKDGNTFKEWEAKAKDFEKQLKGTRFVFSDLLEKLAIDTDRNEGNDFADILAKQDWRLFRKEIEKEPPKVQLQTESKKMEMVVIVDKIEPIKRVVPKQSAFLMEKNEQKKYAEIWSNEIAEIEQFFSNTTFPKEPMKLNDCSTILDVSKFIQSNLNVIKANNGNRTFLPYLERLRQLKNILTLNN
ncbi:hypothetical protein B0A69_20435 [Chryseobacterium shigense]|uniref:Uncharacterized protein n=1 Tax=Chryseobacterium shigense TaxID=297244 RepID=A0A1N7I0P2_9FLAO|nr:DUF6371 domain-containing protein [Chryseobacterium shigense]PQA90696.1 hypothetical protein B0A69_20435 [Chryseobacterium shigense]SIS30643.1 hypothetical protein SAMN05421639_101981 [Chryseobacterium shigense]